jgi:hypothetical protein
VHIRKEASHQKSGDQQRQRNKTLMYQDHSRFSARIADGALPLAKTQTSLAFALRRTPTLALSAPGDSRAATQEGRPCAQNKVLVIMDDEFFRKQVDRGTGGQRDSNPGVTDTIKRVTGLVLL